MFIITKWGSMRFIDKILSVRCEKEEAAKLHFSHKYQADRLVVAITPGVVANRLTDLSFPGQAKWVIPVNQLSGTVEKKKAL